MEEPHGHCGCFFRSLTKRKPAMEFLLLLYSAQSNQLKSNQLCLELWDLGSSALMSFSRRSAPPHRIRRSGTIGAPDRRIAGSRSAEPRKGVAQRGRSRRLAARRKTTSVGHLPIKKPSQNLEHSESPLRGTSLEACGIT